MTTCARPPPFDRQEIKALGLAGDYYSHCNTSTVVALPPRALSARRGDRTFGQLTRRLCDFSLSRAMPAAKTMDGLRRSLLARPQHHVWSLDASDMKDDPVVLIIVNDTSGIFSRKILKGRSKDAPEEG